jgi:hypothetical protein
MMGGPDHKIRAGGKEFRFEMHPYLGPCLLGKRGDPLSTLPPKKSPFWDALYWWTKQGKQVDANGWCVFKWETKPAHILKHMGGKHYPVLG